MLSFASSVITIAVNVVYIAVVLSARIDSPSPTAAVIVIVPFLLLSLPAVLMVALSLFSKPIKADSTWFMFFVSTIAANLVAFIYFAGAKVISSDLIVPLSVAAQLGVLFLIPPYVWAVFTLGLQLTVMPEARKLVTTGPYALSRHPLYVIYIIWNVLDVAVAQTFILAAVGALTIVLLVIRARSEEAILASAFPDDYAAYARKVGWVWRWSPFAAPSPQAAVADPK